MKSILVSLLLLAGLTARAQPLPFPISIFSRQAVTNTDAAGWRTKLGLSAGVTNTMQFKGNLSLSGDPNYPAGTKGDVYRVSAYGKAGGGSGKQGYVGDILICLATALAGNEAAVGSSWNLLPGTGHALLAEDNLATVTDAATARGHLGLGTIATAATSDYIASTVATNLALLSGTNTFTGTNTFNGLISAPQYAFERIIYAGPPNVLTNVTGEYGSSQLVHTVTIPGGVMGTNGYLYIYHDAILQNVTNTASPTRGYTLHHNQTNDLCRIQFAAASTASTNQNSLTVPSGLILKNLFTETNNASGLNQLEGGATQNGSGRSAWNLGQTTQTSLPNVDTRSDWTLYIYGNVGRPAETNIYSRIVITVVRR